MKNESKKLYYSVNYKENLTNSHLFFPPRKCLYCSLDIRWQRKLPVFVYKSDIQKKWYYSMVSLLVIVVYQIVLLKVDNKQYIFQNFTSYELRCNTISRMLFILDTEWSKNLHNKKLMVRTRSIIFF